MGGGLQLLDPILLYPPEKKNSFLPILLLLEPSQISPGLILGLFFTPTRCLLCPWLGANVVPAWGEGAAGRNPRRLPLAPSAALRKQN